MCDPCEFYYYLLFNNNFFFHFIKMSNQVIVLQDGYNRWDKKPNSMWANGTSTLIYTSDQKQILIDTFGLASKNKLLECLAKNNTIPEDIDVVIGTHMHIDHIANLNIFDNCSKTQIIVGNEKLTKDHFQCNIFENNQSISLAKDVELISTPGHTHNDVSVICYNVNQLGTVAIVGDLFESEKDLKKEEIWKLDAGSLNPEIQKINRDYILSVTDYIVPGHDRMFKISDHL